MHVAALQTVVPFAIAGHVLRQAPQWAVLVFVFTSQPLLQSPSQFAKPPMHWSEHVPEVQRGTALVAVAQGLAQPPQFSTSPLVLCSHPLLSDPSQFA